MAEKYLFILQKYFSRRLICLSPHKYSFSIGDLFCYLIFPAFLLEKPAKSCFITFSPQGMQFSSDETSIPRWEFDFYQLQYLSTCEYARKAYL